MPPRIDSSRDGIVPYCTVITIQYVRQLSYIMPMARPLRLAVTMRDLELEHAGLAPRVRGTLSGGDGLGPRRGTATRPRPGC